MYRRENLDNLAIRASIEIVDTYDERMLVAPDMAATLDQTQQDLEIANREPGSRCFASLDSQTSMGEVWPEGSASSLVLASAMGFRLQLHEGDCEVLRHTSSKAVDLYFSL